MMLQRSDGQMHANSQSKRFDCHYVMYILLTVGDGWESVIPTATRRRRTISCIMTCSFAAVSHGKGRCQLLPIPKQRCMTRVDKGLMLM
eukprot:scaffold14615_cov65-Cyclotella_meneghiniana.AAC.15